MRKYDCKIKYFDNEHFSITTYSYNISYDDISDENIQPIEPTEFNQLELDLDNYMDKNEIANLKDVIYSMKHSILTSRNRAKNKIYDYARSNKFEWFVTFTFNPEKVNSFDYDECTKRLSKWLNNYKQRYAPDMKYLVVPELHKSGRFHFHGLFADIGNLKLIDSGKLTKDNDTIYNLGNYKYGFTTATRIKDTYRASSYIGKYITKELSGHIKSKKHYWVSRNLALPVEKKITLDKLISMGIDKEFLENNSCYNKQVEFDVNGVNRKVSYYEFEGNINNIDSSWTNFDFIQ